MSGIDDHSARPSAHAAALAVAKSWRGEARAMLHLGLPMALTQLAQIAMMTTDTVMLGWLGPQALAAAGLGVSSMFFVGISCLGIALASAPMMAQAIGRKLHLVRDVRRSFRQGCWTTIAACLPVMLLLAFIGPILRLLGQDPVLVEQAAPYVHALLLGFIQGNLFIVLRNFVSSLQRPRGALVITLIGVLANGLFNYCLIFGALGVPRLEVVGAGIGTSLSNTLMLALLAGYVLIDRQFRRFHLFGRFWRSDWARFREIFHLGIPIALTMTFEVWLFAGAVMLMGLIGTAELAAHQIAMTIASITFMVPMALGQAGGIRVALAAGAGDPRGVRLAGWTALGLGIGFMACCAVMLWLLPHTLAGAFLGDVSSADRARVEELAVTFLGIAALFQIFDGAQAIGAGILRGLKDTRMPMIFAAVSYWVIGLPVCALLAFELGFGGVGIWYGFCLALILTTLLMVGRFALRERFLPGAVARAAV